MAFQSSPVLDFSFKAAEDLSNYRYHFVKINTSGEVRLLDSAAEIPDGVLQNTPESGEEATVRILGISKVVANAGISEGTFIKPEYVSGTDNGKAQAATSDKKLICGRVIGASSSEDDLVSVLLTPFVGLSPKKTSISTITTADNTTLTTAQMLGGFIDRECSGGARTDTTPDASDLIAAMPDAQAGDSFDLIIRNSSAAANTLTIAAGSGITLDADNTDTVAQGYTRIYRVVLTGAATATMYSISYSQH